MAIEVNVNEAAKEQRFPKLMISEKGRIVLFTSYSAGTMLVGPSVPGYEYKVGEYSTDWNDDLFTDFDGSVTLSNKR